jgi:hypothetical protein
VLPTSLVVAIATVAMTLIPAVLLFWAWRRGLFRDLDTQSRVIFDARDWRVERPWESPGGSTRARGCLRARSRPSPANGAALIGRCGMTAPEMSCPEPAHGWRAHMREVDAVAGYRGLAPEDLEVRLRADASSRRAVLALFAVAIGWLLVGSIFGDIASIKLHSPEFLTEYAWLTFGRVRTAHLHAVNYGWATAALIGMSLWLMPRLVHTELKGAASRSLVPCCSRSASRSASSPCWPATTTGWSGSRRRAGSRDRSSSSAAV